jgi:orotidine-5'-phosphate decarboxylase
MLEAKWAEGKFVCVGLDSDVDKLPPSFADFLLPERVTIFNRRIIETTHDLVCAYKPNVAFYLALGPSGVVALASTIRDIHELAPDVPVILDAKVADIGNTNQGYVKFAFDLLGADAITVHPYLGEEALKPFLERKDKGVIVLCKTSNPGADEFQDVDLLGSHDRLFQTVAKRVSQNWNKNGNCALVAGATYPEQLGQIRKIVGDMPLLIPGVGKQGGDVEQVVKAAGGKRMIINSSSGIIFAEDPRAETQKLDDQITACLTQT